MLSRLKSVVENLPEPFARPLAHVPFKVRLGSAYSQMRREITSVERMDPEQVRQYAFSRFRRIVKIAMEGSSFYRTFYGDHGFRLEDLRALEDVQAVPVVTKDDLRSVPLDQWTIDKGGGYKVNTGGTSGSPLEFYLDRQAWAREWAHNHHYWGRFGYSPRDVKLTFRGENIGAEVVAYNAVHNEYVVSAYHALPEIAQAVRAIVKRRKIRFLHGYPSIISEFACYCRDQDPELAARFGDLCRVILASEYPAPVYRDVIEEVFGVPTFSWYGHSEQAVYAAEGREPFLFEPALTYGLVEALPHNSGEHRLLGTSFHNTACPFIRYDTGDLVDPLFGREGMMRGFRVTRGRVGDYVLDKKGNRISLTALIFGRHHPVFADARFIQVMQDKPGFAHIMVTVPDTPNQRQTVDWASAFDSSNVAIDFTFEVRSQPIRTTGGKVPLLVPDDGAGRRH